MAYPPITCSTSEFYPLPTYTIVLLCVSLPPLLQRSLFKGTGSSTLTYLGTVRTVRSMPDVKIYIRADDLEKWNSIEKKSEFIHRALLGGFAEARAEGRTYSKPLKPAKIEKHQTFFKDKKLNR